MGVLSSACQSVGLILQRKSYIVSTDTEPHSHSNTSSDISESAGVGISSRTTYNRALWHVGLFLFLFANLVGSSIQITSLPLIVLSPLQSVGLVFNTIFHTLLLNEPFTNTSLYGTLVIGTGASFIAYCGGSLNEPDYTLTQFIELLNNENFMTWIAFDLLLISVISIWIFLINKQIKYDSASYHLLNIQDKIVDVGDSRLDAQLSFGLLYWSSLCFLLQSYKSVVELIFIHDNEILKKLKGLGYGSISGILSAFSLLLAKSSIEILLTTFTQHDWKSLNNTVAYFIVIVFLTLGVSQLFLLNKGLKNISTSVLYPLVFFVYNMISISNSLIFFKQWAQLTYPMLFILVVGLLLVMIGVFLLSLQNIEHDNHPDLFSDEENSIQKICDGSSDLVPNSAATSFTELSPLLHSPKSNKYNVLTAQPAFVNGDDSNENPPVCDFNPLINNSASGSVGTISHNDTSGMMSNNDIMAPFIRRTTENLNNAGRKVSGFLKKSVDSFHNINSENSHTTVNNNNSDNLNSNSTPVQHPSSNTDITQKIRNSNHNEIHQYISFDSLRDMTVTSVKNPSRPSSVTNILGDNNTLLHNYNHTTDNGYIDDSFNESNGTVTHGLNILQPIFGKLKNPASILDAVNTSDNQVQPPSSYKSSLSRSFSLKSFAFEHGNTNNNNTINNIHNHNLSFNNDHDKYSRTKRNQSALRSKLDDDYNPNNTFNYSFTNTLEEIQNQMNAYESPSTPFIPLSASFEKLNENCYLISSPVHDNSSHKSSNVNSFDNSNAESSTRVLPKLFSLKNRITDKDLYNSGRGNKHVELRKLTTSADSPRSGTSGNFKSPRRGHSRVLSYEQKELLNELKK